MAFERNQSGLSTPTKGSDMSNARSHAVVKSVRLSGVGCILMASCLAMVTTANAQQSAYAFITADCPGAVATTAFTGLNNRGAFVGGCGAFPGEGAFVAVMHSNGTFTFTPLPAAPAPFGLNLEPYGINDSGTIVGAADAPDGSYSVGFYSNGSTYTFVSHPSFTNTSLRGINASGAMTGYALNDDASGNITDGIGFLYDPTTGVFTDILIPNAVFQLIEGINTVSQVVGEYHPITGGSIALLREPVTAALSYFSVPNGTVHTHARGINDAGLIAGFTTDPATGTQAAYVGNLLNGFRLMHAPAFDPTTIDTYANGMNNSGQMSGFTQSEVDGSSHGLVMLPLPTTKDQCKGGGWEIYGVFKNQGDCVSYVATNGKNSP